MSEHTKEPWSPSSHREFGSDGCGRAGVVAERKDGKSKTVALFYGEYSFQNSRRAAAAVNATKDIPTESLEQGVIGELVEALIAVNENCISHDSAATEALALACAAIRKVRP